MNILAMLIQFLGGLGLFFYAINTLSDSLQKLAANKIRNILFTLTKKTWLATLFGIVMTLALQSSATSTVMVVEFVDAGFMSLSQGLNVSLGASLGTYIVIKLISLPIFGIAQGLIFCGFILYFILKRNKFKTIGQCLISFGLMFVGMTFMSNAFAPLKDMPEIYDLLHQFGSIPILGIVAGCVLTALMQSSSIFLAIMISLSVHGLLSLESIIALVMGAHIGGTLTTLISSLGAEKIDAKRVAIANTLIRIVTTILMLPFFSEFAQVVKFFSNDLPGQVANAYLFSTILMAILFLPINKFIAMALIKFIKAKAEPDAALKLKYIDSGSLNVPAVALNQAFREVRWMGQEILELMFEIIPRLLLSRNSDWIKVIEDTENKIDWHYIELSKFIANLLNQELSQEQIIQAQNIQLIAKEWEQIADRHIMLARKISKINTSNIPFTEEDIDSLYDLYTVTSNIFLKLLRGFEQRDKTIIEEITTDRKEICSLHNDLKVKIISKNVNGLAENKNIILDLENSIFRIGEHIENIALLLSY